MLGIGTGEFVVIAIVLLIAVGPQRLPSLMKAIGKGLREFRRASRELRDAVGFDELMNDDPLEINKLHVSSAIQKKNDFATVEHDVLDDEQQKGLNPEKSHEIPHKPGSSSVTSSKVDNSDQDGTSQ